MAATTAGPKRFYTHMHALGHTVQVACFAKCGGTIALNTPGDSLGHTALNINTPWLESLATSSLLLGGRGAGCSSRAWPRCIRLAP